MKKYNRVLKIAPAFLLLGSMLQGQVNDTLPEQKIEEVVLIGYGSRKKADLTGSVTAVTSDEFNQGAITSADQLIQGKAPGVRITRDGGSPDSPSNIRIRGGSSLSASNNPLIVIDGVPLNSDNPAGVGNAFNLINPNDVESFTILKDASATAIYGSRASNGVIIITTKKGGSRLKINFNTSISVGEVIKNADVMSADQFVDFISKNYPQFKYRLGVGGKSSAPDTPGKIYHTDWQDAIYRKSVSSDNNLSISGSLFNKSLPSRLSLGYNRTEGVVKTSDYSRYSVGLNLSPSFFNKDLKVEINAKGLYSKFNSVDTSGAIGGAVFMDPTKPVYLNQTDLSGDPYDRFGGYYQQTQLNGGQYKLLGGTNPLAILNQRNNPVEVYSFLGNSEFTYKLPVNGLKAVVNLGLEASDSKQFTLFEDQAIATYQNPAGAQAPNDFVFNPGASYRENQTIVNQTLDSYLVYERKFSGAISNFLVQGGYSYQNFKTDGNKENYTINGASGIREILPGSTLNLNNRYYNVLNLQSFIGRTNIDFYNKYLLTATFRADASSYFQKDQRWGYFPAVALAWKVKEDFFTETAAVNDLKLRIGWGQTGNQNISAAVNTFYPSTPLFSIGGTTSQYFPGITTYSALPYNPKVTWETTTTWNAGIDFAFFKGDRISGSVDVYERKTKDLLSRLPLPPGQGLTNNFIDNVGSLENRGVELDLKVIPFQSDSFTGSLFGNFAYNDGEITDLKNVQSIPGADSGIPGKTGLVLGYNAVGQQPYSAWVFQQVYDQNGNPLAEVYADRNNDGAITNEDRYYKAIRPRWTYGFGTNFNYLQWDFAAGLRGQIGGEVYNTRKLQQGVKSGAVPADSNSLSNVIGFAADSPFETLTDQTYFSDHFLEDATFLKLDNVTLGYKFNKIFGDTDLRIYASVNNVYTWTDFTGQDPENFNGIDNNYYPRPRVYTIGFNFNY